MASDEIHIGVVAYPSVDKLVMRGIDVVIVQNANRCQWLDGCRRTFIIELRQNYMGRNQLFPFVTTVSDKLSAMINWPLRSIRNMRAVPPFAISIMSIGPLSSVAVGRTPRW